MKLGIEKVVNNDLHWETILYYTSYIGIGFGFEKDDTDNEMMNNEG